MTRLELMHAIELVVAAERYAALTAAMEPLDEELATAKRAVEFARAGLQGCLDILVGGQLQE